MLFDVKNGQTSVVLRIKLRDSSVTTGAGLTGLTFSSTGLIISTIADNESTPTTYTAAGSTIEDITTLGTYAAPTATKCRFKLIDNTNHPGIYELQLADARFAVSGAKSLTISFSGATNLAECDVVVPLRTVDPYVTNGKAPVTLASTDVTGNVAADVQTILGTASAGAAGYVGIDWSAITSPTAAVNLSGTLISTSQSVASVSTAVTLGSLDSPSLHNSTLPTQTGATSTTVILDSGAEATNDNLYAGLQIKIYSGTGLGQVRTITAYTASTKTATVDRAWTVQPASGDAFALLATAAAKVDSSLQVTAGTVGDKTGYSLSQTFPTNFASLAIDASGRMDVGKILGTASAGAAGYVGVDWSAVNAPTTAVDLSGTTISTSQQVASVSGAVGSVTNRVTANSDQIAGSATAATNLGNTYAAFETGTAQAGGASSITLRAGASSTTDFYKDQAIFVLSGTGAPQTNRITAYNGTTKVATVETAWATAPDATSTYLVVGRIG